MTEPEVSDSLQGFQALALAWLSEQGELLALSRYARAAGAKDWGWVRSEEDVHELLARPGQTSVVLLRQPQLPLRGMAGPDLLARFTKLVPGGMEWLVLPYETGQHLHTSALAAGETHEELRAALYAEDVCGHTVAIGPYPPFWEVHDDVREVTVPFPDGQVRRGIY